MPVKRDPSGARYVEAEVEAPGTPEEVWRAIATGPGISSWFVPTRVEEHVGGAINSNFGPGMESLATITAWEPPYRYSADSRDDMGPGDPTIATEWSVEARSGGTCTVRVVHRWFTDSDAWDDQFEGHTYGWIAVFRVLRLYLDHFSGQDNASFQVIGIAPEPQDAAWATLTGSLGLTGAAVGERVSASDGAPPLAGVVAWTGQPEWPELLMRLEEPTSGIVHMAPHAMGGQVYLMLRVYLFGEQAAAVAARAEPEWQAWVKERFPPMAEERAAD